MNGNVGMVVVKKDRNKIISVNKAYSSHYQPISPLHAQSIALMHVSW